MPRKPAGAWKGDLPALELECIKVLWEGGEMTVREARERLLPRRALAYTTVLTLLDRLARKGAVTRRKSGRAHVYQAAYTRSAAREVALARLLENYFGGSRELFLQYLRPAEPGPLPVEPGPLPAGPAMGPAPSPPRPPRVGTASAARAAAAEQNAVLDPTLL